MTTLTGVLTGQTIALDERRPELEGQRVRLLLESADDDVASHRAAAWREWLEHGPQGPIEDDDVAESP